MRHVLLQRVLLAQLLVFDLNSGVFIAELDAATHSHLAPGQLLDIPRMKVGHRLVHLL